MKKKYLIFVLCFMILAGCASGEISQIGESKITEAVLSDTLLQEPEEEKENNSLSPVDIDKICGDLHYQVFGCNDGSQIIRITADHIDFYYIRYMPSLLADGTYDFFRQLTPSYEVSYHEDNRLEIPLSINESGDFRLILRNQAIIFLDEEDDQFSREYSALDDREQEMYRLSLQPDSGMPEEELRRFLRSCVYNGNVSVLDELYSLAPEEDPDAGYRLELASYYAGNPGWSEENPYQPEIFYGESTVSFPHAELLEMAARSLQTGRDLGALGCEEIKVNYDWDGVWETVKLHEDERDLSEVGTDKIYKYDLNGDGLMEILFFFPGGTVGNGSWEIVFLDDDGSISGRVSDTWVSSLRLYRYQQNYFFLEPMEAFEDREFFGWKMYVLDHDRDVVSAEIYCENIGFEIVFSDQHVPAEDFYYLDSEMEDFIDLYKNHGDTAVGTETEPDEQIREWFQEWDIDKGRYGKLDVNNDGIEDWTNVDKYYPYGRLPYNSDYYVADGKTRELLDLTGYFKVRDYNLCHLIPYRIGEKNYFVCLGRNSGNYTVRLIEIKGMEIVEVHTWFVSSKKRILMFLA